MFVACGIWCLADVSCVSPSSEQRVARLGGGRGGGGERGGEVPAAHNSKTINDNGMKFGGVVENHKLINLV